MNWDSYKFKHGEEATAQFRKVAEKVMDLVRQRKWDLDYKFNQDYVGFKFGRRLVISVGWDSTYKWHLWLRLPKNIVDSFKGNLWRLQLYNRKQQFAKFRPINSDNPDISEMIPFIEKSYQYVSEMGR